MGNNSLILWGQEFMVLYIYCSNRLLWRSTILLVLSLLHFHCWNFQKCLHSNHCGTGALNKSTRIKKLTPIKKDRSPTPLAKNTAPNHDRASTVSYRCVHTHCCVSVLTVLCVYILIAWTKIFKFGFITH